MKKIISNTALHIGIASVIALAGAASVAFLFQHGYLNTLFGRPSGNVSKTHQINLTESGFVPSALTIAKGDTIVFTTTRGKPFWPASDLHPTHTIYPDFDPKQPIDPDKSWSFRFDKEGEWQFHDHLAPLFRGIVVVRDPSTVALLAQTRIQTAQQCVKDATFGDKTQCWQNALTQALQQQGADAAYQIFDQFYNADADFRKDCHGFTHTIGQQAYQKFKNHEYLGVSSKTAYCSFGFYHGFIEAFLHHGGNITEALDFCDYIESQLAGHTSILSSCIHGIGHGVTDASDPKTWGSAHAIIEPGLELCEKVGRSTREKDLCASGVFNSLFGSLYHQAQYRLSYDKRDPMAICRTLDKSYFKAACYEESNTLLMDLANKNIREAARFIEAMSEPEYQARAIDALMGYSARFIRNRDKDEVAMQICHTLQPQLRAPCIAGIAVGFMEFGPPEKEYIQALEVCRCALNDEKHSAVKYFINFGGECGRADDRGREAMIVNSVNNVPHVFVH